MTVSANDPHKQTAASEDAPRELNRLEVLRGLRISTWEASYSTVHATLTTGAFLTGFALWLGADNFVMGLLTAIPTFAGLVQIVASYLGERWHERRLFTAWFSVAGRSLWLLILLLPLLLPGAALMPFLLLYALSFVLLNIPAPAWTSWMSDLVPPDHRGRYFARRNMVAGIVGMIVGLPAAQFLDHTVKRAHHETLGFGALFGVAVVAGLASFVCLLRQPEPPRRQAADNENAAIGLAGMLDYYRAPFADPDFRRLLAFNMLFGIGQFFAAPFFTVYALKPLGLTYTALQIFATLTSLTSLASMPLWGYLGDKFGFKALLVLGVCGVFTLPISWMFTIPHHTVLNIALLTELNLAGGLFWAGVGLMQFNLLINMSPPEKTGIYVAAMAAVTGLTGGLAPLAGGLVMHGLDHWHGRVLGLALSNYHVTFLIAALLRLISLVFLRPVRERHAVSTRDVLQQLGQSNPRAWRHIRQMQGGDVETRLRATEALGETRTRLATGELETALTDPSPAVREEAAHALGEIGESSSVEALIQALQDPAVGLVEEAASALGRIGDRRANAPLIALLSAPVPLARRDRVVVARALGQLGGSDAVDALLGTLEAVDGRPGEEEMTETLVAALGRAGSSRTTPALLALLERPETSRPLRLALVRALGEIGDPSARSALRALLTAADDDPALLPLLADALGRLRDLDSVLPLLDRLERLESPVARKQVAHAVGTLLGAGEAVYTLLSREEFARDAAVARLIGDTGKLLRSASGERTLRAAVNAYTEGDFVGCLRALEGIARALPTLPLEDAFHAEQVRLCRRLLEHAAGRAVATPPTETVLLAFCALHRMLEDLRTGY